MPNEQPLLTIAIPTYNRAPYLERLLSSLQPQLAHELSVELIISDNASSDNTSNLVNHFLDRGLTLKYIHNQTNIGADANIIQCFTVARGKYVWVFGDDDILVPNGLSRVMKFLHGNEYDLVYVSPYGFRKDPLIEQTKDPFNRSAEIITDGLDYGKQTNAMLGFISSVIANKKRFQSLPSKPLESFIGTSLAQLGWILPLLASQRRSLFVWERLVACQQGNTGGWGVCQVFGNNLDAITKECLNERQDIAKAIMNNTLRHWFPEMIIAVREGSAGAVIQEDMRSILSPSFRSNWRYWCFIYPVCTFPLWPAKSIVFTIRQLNRIEKMLRLLRQLTLRANHQLG